MASTLDGCCNKSSVFGTISTGIVINMQRVWLAVRIFLFCFMYLVRNDVSPVSYLLSLASSIITDSTPCGLPSFLVTFLPRNVIIYGSFYRWPTLQRLWRVSCRKWRGVKSKGAFSQTCSIPTEKAHWVLRDMPGNIGLLVTRQFDLATFRKRQTLGIGLPRIIMLSQTTNGPSPLDTILRRLRGIAFKLESASRFWPIRVKECENIIYW